MACKKKTDGKGTPIKSVKNNFSYQVFSFVGKLYNLISPTLNISFDSFTLLCKNKTFSQFSLVLNCLASRRLVKKPKLKKLPSNGLGRFIPPVDGNRYLYGCEGFLTL